MASLLGKLLKRIVPAIKDTKAEDAIEIDTSYMSIEQVINKVFSFIK